MNAPDSYNGAGREGCQLVRRSDDDIADGVLLPPEGEAALLATLPASAVARMTPAAAVQMMDGVKSALVTLTRIDAVKDIRDKAQAIAAYTKQRGDSLEVQNSAAEVKLRAERRMGELLAVMTNGEAMRSADSALLHAKSRIPSFSGIYLVFNPAGLLYIGQAKNLRKRWSGGHHRRKQLAAFGDDVSIGWFYVPLHELAHTECVLIEAWTPLLNGRDLPRQPRADAALSLASVKDDPEAVRSFNSLFNEMIGGLL